jgi:hypothetical protein
MSAADPELPRALRRALRNARVRTPCPDLPRTTPMRKLALPILCMLCAACAQLPQKTAREYAIYEAHATQVLAVRSISALRASSFVVGDGKEANFPTPPLAIVRHSVPIEVFASTHVSSQGFDQATAGELALRLSQMLDRLPHYTARPPPVRYLAAYAAAPSESVRMHRFSLTSSRRHRVRFAIGFAMDDSAGSIREAVRTFAHELLHLSLGVNGRSKHAERVEEGAASALEHCIEVDVFGTTTAPGQHLRIATDDGTAIGRSISAGHAADSELLAVFSGQDVISSAEAGALRDLCSRRIRQVAAPALSR